MALNNRLVSELIRQRMGWKDDQNAARVINLIPEALKQFGRQYAADPFTRPLVTTPKATTTIAIGSRGQVNLVTGYDTYQFLLEYLDKGLMYFLPSVTATPYILSGGTYASGYWTFNANPQEGETIAVNGVTFTFLFGNVAVSGAGTSAVNGTYTYRGMYDEGGGNGAYPYYTLTGEPDPDPNPGGFFYSVFTDGNLWYITDFEGNYLYYGRQTELSGPVCDFPYEANWVTLSGDDPAPTVAVAALTSVQVQIGLNFRDTRTNFVTTLNASANASINVATYSEGSTRTQVIGTYDTLGTGGNSFTLANSSFNSITRSGATFTGGASTAYALSVSAYTDYFTDLSRVQFSTTVTLPTGISASTNYYLTDYTIDGDIATFNLSSTSDGLTPMTISTAGSGVLTMALQDSNDDIPLQLVSPKQAPLSQYLDSVFDYAYVQGNLLTVLPIDDVFPTGNVAFAVASFPANLADLPDSEEAEQLFLQILANMVGVPVQPV